ncbi:mycothiol synthase [Xylanimonas allomyrinae]|uniref:mycothiol synthase n=1 Tax=Xylanimonas allomyrinae TaxID=2509459 RepID=UPI001FE697F8|nr:mycothiol synthase [Xylanimonas allomyrinae]
MPGRRRSPLSEQPLLRLAADEPWLTHAVARSRTGAVTGYAQIDRSGGTASAEIVVHPEHRRGGLGRLLLRTAERDARLPQFSGTPGQRGKALRVWAHGDLAPARAFAASAGYVVVRELLFLTRPLPAPAPAPLPTGYAVRAFVPGRDDDAWVALNARAFAAHPEQGRLTVADLRDRMAAPWFDPEGFLLLTGPDGALAGSIWTKVTEGPQGSDGEIYAVGVDPAHRGRGLGAALTGVGLAYLARHAERAVLYVDGDNSAAIAVYRAAGFMRETADVQYGRPNDAMI